MHGDVLAFGKVDIRAEDIVARNGVIPFTCKNRIFESNEVFFAVDDHRDDKDGYAVFRGSGGDDDIIPAGSKTGKQEAALAYAVGNVCARFCAYIRERTLCACAAGSRYTTIWRASAR